MAPQPGQKGALHRTVSFLFVSSIVCLCAYFATQFQQQQARLAPPAPVELEEEIPVTAPTAPPKPIKQKDVRRLLHRWAEGIVAIGKAEMFGEDYRAEAADFIDRFYAYDVFPVMFKPSRAAERPFRPTREGALSYFVGGNPSFPEDSGFALNPWKRVRFSTKKIKIDQDSAVAMGMYTFVDMSGKKTHADFTIGVRYDPEGRLRIVLHHSSLPYKAQAPPPEAKSVSEEEVKAALKAWGDAIVEIGKVKLHGGDYETKAAEVIDTLYGYDVYPVLFKPTKAADQPFRSTFEGALSYFAGGNPEYPEDKGFAINPWKEVRFDTTKISLHESSAIAMGSYYFKDLDDQETLAEFTFGYRHDGKGRLRIVLHHSSLPYSARSAAPARQGVTPEQVHEALKEWGDGIVEIGKVWRSRGDYRQVAATFIDSQYAYGVFPVLFKPSRAKDQPFRATREGALSYFVGGSADFPEDAGFALKPWRQVEFDASQISTHENSAVAMGTYDFTSSRGEVMKAEFTFGFRLDETNKLRIVVHHSSLPFVKPPPKKTPRQQDVTKDEVLSALNDWAESIVEVGQVFQERGDYQEAAAEMVDRLYAYDVYPVLFKPTKAAWHPFRPTREGAISYFVGGNFNFPEDEGFALAPWKEVRFNEPEVSLQGPTALAMGVYEFVGMDGSTKEVQFTIGYRHDDSGNLRIVLHHSSMPYGSG